MSVRSTPSGPRAPPRRHPRYRISMALSGPAQAETERTPAQPPAVGGDRDDAECKWPEFDDKKLQDMYDMIGKAAEGSAHYEAKNNLGRTVANYLAMIAEFRDFKTDAGSELEVVQDADLCDIRTILWNTFESLMGYISTGYRTAYDEGWERAMPANEGAAFDDLRMLANVAKKMATRTLTSVRNMLTSTEELGDLARKYQQDSRKPPDPEVGGLIDRLIGIVAQLPVDRGVVTENRRMRREVRSETGEYVYGKDTIDQYIFWKYEVEIRHSASRMAAAKAYVKATKNMWTSLLRGDGAAFDKKAVTHASNDYSAAIKETEERHRVDSATQTKATQKFEQWKEERQKRIDEDDGRQQRSLDDMDSAAYRAENERESQAQAWRSYTTDRNPGRQHYTARP